MPIHTPCPISHTNPSSLSPSSPPSPAPSIPDTIDRWLQTTRGAFSPNTERALRSDLKVYLTWCQQNRLTPWPAQADHLVRFIHTMASHKAPATVRRYLSSLNTLHKATGWDNPLHHTTVQLALKRMYRDHGRRQTQVLGLTWTLRQYLLHATGDRLIDARNRALLAVAYDALLRRSELVCLQVADFQTAPDGSATVLVRSSKTDPWGTGHLLYLAPDTAALVREWLRRSGPTDGPLFRSLRKQGTLGGRLDPSQVPRIYKIMARQAGLDEQTVAGLSGHSTRVGAAQDMIASGIELPAILQAGRWKSTAMVWMKRTRWSAWAGQGVSLFCWHQVR